MLVLLDNNVPRGVARALAGHAVKEARLYGWSALKNGLLLANAERTGFDVFVTADKNIRYQQNFQARRIAIVVLTQQRWQLVRRCLPEISAAVDAATLGSFDEVEIPDDQLFDDRQ